MMSSNGRVVTKRLPDCSRPSERKAFLSEIRRLAADSYQPMLCIDMSCSSIVDPAVTELLLQCVELIEGADGRVLMTAVPPEAAVLLEVTRLNSIADVIPLDAGAEVNFYRVEEGSAFWHAA